MFEAIPRLVDCRSHRLQRETYFVSKEEDALGKGATTQYPPTTNWISSSYQYTALSGFSPDFTPGPMRSPREMSESRIGDRHLSWFTDEGRIEIAIWMRTEHLVDDFIEAASRFADAMCLSGLDGEANRVTENSLTQAHPRSRARFSTGSVDRNIAGPDHAVGELNETSIYRSGCYELRVLRRNVKACHIQEDPCRQRRPDRVR